MSEEEHNESTITKAEDIQDKIPENIIGQTCECGADKSECSCKSTNGSMTRSYIYALGKVSYQFPYKALKMEVTQVANIKDIETSGLTDPELIHKILSDPNNHYIAREMCWTLTIEKNDTYILVPNSFADISLLVNALRSSPRRDDNDLVIGTRGPISQPEMCGGLMLPLVYVDQIYSFDTDTLIKAIPKPKATSGEKFAKTSTQLFERIMQMADNVGSSDEHRALNYLSVRYPVVYEKTAAMLDRDFSITSIQVKPSRLIGSRNIVDVIFSYQDRKASTAGVVEKYMTRVDVTEKFPFLQSPLQPYYDR